MGLAADDFTGEAFWVGVKALTDFFADESVLFWGGEDFWGGDDELGGGEAFEGV